MILKFVWRLDTPSNFCRGWGVKATATPTESLREGSKLKWFKHMTGMKNDERINLLFEAHGHRGVLTYIWVLEEIALRMDETDKCNLKTTKQHWGKMLRTYWKDAEKILTSCRDHGLIFLTSSGDLVDISCPKLLEIRARKKPIGSKSRTLEVEVDIEVDKDKEKTTGRAGKVRLTPEGTWMNLDGSKIDYWKTTFPGIDVDYEIRKAAAWIVANPTRKKSNYERFLVNWLTRSQDRAKSGVAIKVDDWAEIAKQRIAAKESRA